ncbi:MAG: hypothetical protein IZT59_10710 [Verrucomicrobia bacterium]|jgi:hypothetical protein|nr:hypothetical protein [Verrucomicrobiota bacterium]|tara:strand:- start:18437 stop:18622 length:186 start_codon:yes stop_codon:yes gene_type:complete
MKALFLFAAALSPCAIEKPASEKGAPAPGAEDVAVSDIKGGTFAVLRFKGWDEEEKRAKAT